VRNGLITSSEFSAGISQTYRKASLANIEARALTGFGVTVPNSGKNYFISGGTFQAPIDLLDETSVNRWFLKNSFKQNLMNMNPIVLGVNAAVRAEIPLQAGPKNSAFPDPTKPARSPYVK